MSETNHKRPIDSGRAFNFNPGPAVLPLEVLERAAEQMINFRGTGIGIMEVSHRSKAFETLLEETKTLLRELLNLPKRFEILFTTGGATQQFSMVPMNLLTPEVCGNYLVTGVWAEKAEQEARKFGRTKICATSKAEQFRFIPKTFSVSEDAAYLHFTSNNTIVGTQYREEPQSGNATLVCDASSDLLSHPIASERYGLIYACAQKNVGPTGITVVILDPAILPKARTTLPILMDYRTYLENNSLYNTIPTFPVYMVWEVLEWLKRQGGVSAMATRNETKAALLYDTLDSLSFYRGHAELADRSRMNVSFFCPTPELDDEFAKEAEQAGLKGLKGHKLLGGLRASIYNAFPIEGVQTLCEFMKSFAMKKG